MNQPPAQLTHAQIFRFWSPLAATWLMMAIEGPFLAAVIARMGDTAHNLAAYGVAYAFGLVAESPIIMLMSAAATLVRDADSYRRLRNFSTFLNLGVTAALALLVVPPVFDLVGRRLIGLTPEVARLTHLSLVLLLPWPAAIGFRRFYQGVLIRGHKTRRVAVATSVRVVAMAATALALYRFAAIPGACVGALALSAGVTAEALLTRYMAAGAIADALAAPVDADAEPMGYREIGRFYLPLALTPFIGLSVHPMVTFFLGRGAFPVESLAVMPVIYGLTFVFRAIGLSFQEVALALVGKNFEHYRMLRDFAVRVAAAATAVLALIAFTPLADVWFVGVSGLTPELAAFATTPLMIMAIIPALTVWISFQRSILMVGRLTGPITVATAIEAAAIFLLLGLVVAYSGLSGMTGAAMAYIFGRFLSIGYLVRPQAMVLKKAPPGGPASSP
ncbi:hypothetical protein DESUT3_34520 [Desulfuromonas versatilis]|uniref:Multi antimicrobial extrusion protein MatE n=1 Tax=Desulfuromonas versatilis TaxID=2802975 RepID=A0ABN6E1Z9_9BACT|nr:hypothetical protein [Desulfuromonas versatilis]BCR06383.1 hypothetical protein DESUT3_34520 [Desulfuromonas versatilis]